MEAPDLTKTASGGGRSDAPAAKADRAKLVERWAFYRGSPPPKGMSTRLLSLAVAYEAQAKEQGGLSARTRKRLGAWALGSKRSVKETGSPPPERTVRAGTRLVREWQGKSHVVDVQEDHVVYDGKSHRSLSAVARAITGARWSGPRFFRVSSR